MSHVLRLSLKYTIRRVGAHAPLVRNGNILKPVHSSYSRFISNLNYNDVARNTDDTIENMIRNLDSNVKRLGRLTAQEVKKVLNEFKAAGCISTSQSLMMIRCCGSLLVQENPEARMKLVQEVWKTLETLGIERDISHYNALLKVYLENESPFTPSDFLADLKKEGLEPNIVTYQRLITKYCQLGDIDGATRILQFMRERNMPINIAVLNSLILGHSRANDMESAEGVLSVMKEAGIEPSAETFTLLICGYIRQKNLEKADSLMRDCEFRGITLAGKDYMDIIYTYATCGYSDEIDKILNQINRTYAYNQDASNLTLKLATAGKLEEALKVLKSVQRSNRDGGSELLPLGSFFIAHLIRSDVSPDIVVKCCTQLMKENLNPYALTVAIQNSLQLGKVNAALVLLKAAKENDLPIRYHYFWPLLVSRGKQKDVAGMFDILSTMYKDFGCAANSETLRDYVVPFLLEENTDIGNVVMDLKGCGVSTSSYIASVVFHLLTKEKIQKAAEIAESYGAHYPVHFIRKPLVASFLSTKDVQSFVTLLREIGIGTDWFAKNNKKTKNEENSQEPRDYREYTGQILTDAVPDLVKQNSIAELQELFQQLLANGVGISVKSAERISHILGDKFPSEIKTIVGKLTSDEFATPRPKVKSTRLSISSLDMNSLERLYEMMKAKGESTMHIKKQLFVTYARDKNLEKLLEIKRELDSENFVLSKGMYASLISAFVECDKLDEAMNVFQSVLEREPDFNLNSTKLLKLALLLVQKGRYDEAFRILQKKANDHEVKDIIEEVSFANSALCRKMLDIFAENGDVQSLREFCDLFLSNELVEVNNILLGPLIKAHLKSGDVESAVKEFENCVLKYKVTPWKHELCRTLIQKEDAANLQRVTDLSTQVHGESNSLYDLILSFVECGRVNQAHKLLQSPWLRLRADRLLSASKKYSDEGAPEHLLNLLELTKGMKMIDRSEIFYYTLLVYNKANDTKNALSLWMQMQDEDVNPTDKFLITLAELLARNNVPIPFSVPTKSDSTSQVVSREDDKFRIGSSSARLRKLLNSGNIDEALTLLKQLNPEQFNKTDWSLLIEACVQKNRYTDAKNLFHEYYSKTGEIPVYKIMKYFLGAAMKQPDIDLFEYVNDRISKDLKKRLSFDNHRCRAYLNAQRCDEYLTKVEESLRNAKSKEEFDAFVEAFPRGGVLSIASKMPEYASRIEKLILESLKRDEKNVFLANTLWTHYMSTKRFNDADKIWKTYLQSYDQGVSFRKLTNHVARHADTELGLKIINTLESKSNITSASLGLAYGVLISAFVQKNLINEALEILERALSRVTLDDIMRSGLVTLKAACIAKNMRFPYEIPSKSIEI